MDKEYVLYMLGDRINTLKQRYRDLVNNKNNYTPGGAAVGRSECKRDLNLCLLIEELVTALPGKLCLLSDEAIEGLERIMEPVERHRRLKEFRKMNSI